MRTLLAAALAAVTLSAVPAAAGTVSIQPIVDYGRLTNVSISSDSGAHYIGELAGQLQLRRTGGTDTSVTATGDFLTFCIEPSEFLAASTLNVQPLAFGDTAKGGMGQVKADAIARVFARVLPVIGSSVANNIGAALQVSIWEIERETGKTFGLTSGTFQVQAPADVLALASTYLGYANHHIGPRLTNLVALTGTGVQDQLGQTGSTIDTPEPAAFGVLGLALAGLIAARRRAR